ncbi:MAG: hypothetical protein C4520_08680 [Candidatus Abyssobacteria bacterium SURF_5]|uniref:DUF4198 domain-containing protein n=1 Tax=Abyssobacteria bacterium (strain SURF_5) TaxID=2093360 RepID=A0A3A4NNG5_ABYX5|nr:MAG: hypothetical protein C4520_08680 [Candidatus Abyssubacteria bacterium SURF_5]
MPGSLMKSTISLVMAAALACWWNAGHVMAAEPEVAISKDRIEISSFYHGTTITAEAFIPAGCQAALVVSSERKDHPLNQKGKVGPLWMNIGTATIKGAPETYFLFSSVDPLDSLAPGEVLEKHGLGYEALRAGVTVEHAQSQLDELFPEFLKLKEEAGLYRTSPSSINLEPTETGEKHLLAEIPIPANIPAGEYRVQLFCFNDREFSSNSSSKLTVVKVGLPEKVSALAFEHPAVYGILSILIAMAAGIFMGLIFGSKKKEPH